MKNCVFCAEAIQDAAVVCRWCGRDVPHGELEAAVGDHVANGWTVGERTSRVVLLQKTGERPRTLSVGDDGTLLFRDGQSAAIAYRDALTFAPGMDSQPPGASETHEPPFTKATFRDLGKGLLALLAFAIFCVLFVVAPESCIRPFHSLTSSPSGGASDTSSATSHVGDHLCSALTGVYLGRVVGVTQGAKPGGVRGVVYDYVDREGNVHKFPVEAAAFGAACDAAAPR